MAALLDDNHFSDVKKTNKLAIIPADKMKKLGKPLESILFVSRCAPDDPRNIQVNNAS